jgi:hypothetical protein
MMKKTVLWMVMAALALSGCANMSDGTRTKTEATALGAGGGALLGGLIGALAGGSDAAWVGAAVGAGVGGVAGFAYGTHVAKEKAKYASQEDWLDACIHSAEKVNRENRAYNAALEKEIRVLAAETDSLAAVYAQKKVRKSALAKEKKKIDAKLAEADKALERSTFELENQKSALADARKSGESPQVDQLDREIAELKATIAELEGHTESLASMSARMAV